MELQKLNKDLLDTSMKVAVLKEGGASEEELQPLRDELQEIRSHIDDLHAGRKYVSREEREALQSPQGEGEAPQASHKEF